jgi:DNA-binding NtrC family response regulator
LNGTRVAGRRLAANERVDVAVGETIELGSTSFVLQRRVNAGETPAQRYAVQFAGGVLVGSSPTERALLAPSKSGNLLACQSLQGEIDELERERILQALDACGGNQSRAAKVLGMNRGTLIRRLESYGVPRPRK